MKLKALWKLTNNKCKSIFKESKNYLQILKNNWLNNKKIYNKYINLAINLKRITLLIMILV